MNSLNSLEWRDLNAIRNYPFTDESNLSFANGFIPQTWILDARIYSNKSYEAAQTPYISKIIRDDLAISLAISSASGQEIGEAKVRLSLPDESIPIVDSQGFVNGCIVINTVSTGLAQTLPEGETVLQPSVARFLPHVCQYLPGPQVQTINAKYGDFTMRADAGIKLTALDSSTIKVDIIGDPHFNRYNCPTGQTPQTDDIIDLSSRFLKKLRVLHYIKNSSGQIIGPYKSSLTRKQDGSILLSLSTPLSPSGSPVEIRETRPAFRIQVSENTITLSLAGA
jgi:hypothetical protein